MIDGAGTIKLLEIGRLFISAVGFWATLCIWLIFRNQRNAVELVVRLRQMFASVAVVLFVASVANLWRVAYGSELFARTPGLQALVGLLYAAMTGTAVRFLRQLVRGG